MNEITEHDLYIAARTIAGEARGEPHEGRLAVGWVIRNRWESSKWFGGRTVADVCLRPYQFSAWNENDPNRAFLEKLTLTHSVLQQCMYAAIGTLLGFEPDPTSGATHYFAKRTPYPSWALDRVPICTIGNHMFFVDID